MSVPQEVKEWWTKALLNESTAAHPIFGRKFKVKVDGDVVTLSGEVESAEQIDKAEREAMSLTSVHHVVNKLRVKPGADETYHMQTVIGVFADPDAAELTRRGVADAKIHPSSRPRVLRRGERAGKYLRERTEAAHVGEDGAHRFLQLLDDGRVLVADRVPEDDALRIIAALEGSNALSIETLPPEPDSIEEE